MQVELTGWKATLHTTADAFAATPASPGAPEPAAARMESSGPGANASGPSWVRVNELSATSGEVTLLLGNSQTVVVRSVNFHAETPGGPEWTTQVQVGSITAGTLTAGNGSVDLHSTPDTVTFNDLTLHCGDGQITGGGELGLAAPHALKGSFTATSIPVAMLVAARWQVKLSGLVSGSVVYQGDDGAATATGKISVAGGKFNLFPWLGKVTMLVGLPDITGMEIDQATSDFVWKNHLLTLQNIDVRKPGVFRIGGTVDIAGDDTIDGRLKLGLPASAVSKWPALQTSVFNVTNEDFAWTDVHVTGTPDALQEDLSPRLLNVGGEQATELLEQTKSKAADLLKALLK